MDKRKIKKGSGLNTRTADAVVREFSNPACPRCGWWSCCGIDYPMTVTRCTKCGGMTNEAVG